ncbi:ROK family protein [Candidatus Aerophobetes bacterium]|nr:ROK family protein [Candidatus Aerophobetes bacterium]
MARAVIGVDLGGTTLAIGIINNEGRIIIQKVQPTPKSLKPDGLAKIVKENIKEFTANIASTLKLKALKIGISVPSFTTKEGEVIHAPNLGWINVPLKKIMEERIGMPVYIEHDVKCATLAEKIYGAGRNCNDFIYITYGTGLSAGIVINGSIRRGIHNSAGNIGHWVINEQGRPCTCGLNGCLETFIGREGIIKRARSKIQTGRDIGVDIDHLTVKRVFRSAKEGNVVARELVPEIAKDFGLAIAGLVAILDPGKVIIGGGIARAGEILFSPLRKVVKNNISSESARCVEIIPASLENPALIGAALIALEEKGINEF